MCRKDVALAQLGDRAGLEARARGNGPRAHRHQLAPRGGVAARCNDQTLAEGKDNSLVRMYLLDALISST